jgi:beta-phosphoglucomutase-like phosphatase (HAD superfamily)
MSLSPGRLLSSSDPRALLGRRVLIFDFDGTVADTSALHAQAFNQVLASLGLSVHYPSIAGLKTQDAMRQCLQQAGHACVPAIINDLTRRKQALVRELMSSSLTALPGVDAFLSWSQSRFRLAMGTSGSRGTVALALRCLGHEHLFNPLVCADDVAHAKPAPDLFAKVLNLMSARPDEALVFEDAPAGFAAARAAGIDHVDARAMNWDAWRLPA